MHQFLHGILVDITVTELTLPVDQVKYCQIPIFEVTPLKTVIGCHLDFAAMTGLVVEDQQHYLLVSWKTRNEKIF